MSVEDELAAKVNELAFKLDRIREAAQHALDSGCATGSATTLAATILRLLEETL